MRFEWYLCMFVKGEFIREVTQAMSRESCDNFKKLKEMTMPDGDCSYRVIHRKDIAKLVGEKRWDT